MSMTPDPSRVRHSAAEDAKVESDPIKKAEREAANAVRQAERVREMVLSVLDGRSHKLGPSAILDLNRCAIDGLGPYAGLWRPASVEIAHSKHVPPSGFLVPELVEDLCDYVNERWDDRSPIHLCAFVMWRLNWIHPFTDGNGRTSRAASYYVLCARSRTWFAGTNTIPEQIVARRQPYYDALEAADANYVTGQPYRNDVVSEMEELLGAMLAKQLKGAFEAATSITHPSSTR